MDTSRSVFDPVVLARSREAALADLERELTTYARTAPEPVDRMVQAELAEEVRCLRARWEQRGLLTGGAGREAAVAA